MYRELNLLKRVQTVFEVKQQAFAKNQRHNIYKNTYSVLKWQIKSYENIVVGRNPLIVNSTLYSARTKVKLLLLNPFYLNWPHILSLAIKELHVLELEYYACVHENTSFSSSSGQSWTTFWNPTISSKKQQQY